MFRTIRIVRVICTVILFLLSYTSGLGDVKFGENFNKLVLDISDDCEYGYSTSIHLPFGSGSADARVILLRSLTSSIRNCSIVVTGPRPDNKNCNDKKCMVLAVTEFFNYEKWSTPCRSIYGGVFVMSEDNKLISNICDEINNQTGSINFTEHQIYTIAESNKFVINLNFKHFSGTIKITVTSSRYLGAFGFCVRSKQFSCVLKDQIFCIDRLLICDGNPNCGYTDLYDEYCKRFYLQDNMMGAIVYGFILIAILIFFFIQILRVCVPTVADHFFIFNEGEDNKFVLASQSLPPLHIEEEEIASYESEIVRN